MEHTRERMSPSDLDLPASRPAEHTTRPPTAEVRSDLRAVGLPSEHGGWGLTAEPILLGLLLAPSLAGLLLGLAGVLAFLARTPLKFVLVDASRHRTLRRTVVAGRLVIVETTVLLLLVIGAFLLTSRPFWIPALFAGPLVAIQMWFDMRSRSRRLLPELAGSIGIATLAAVISIAGDATIEVAIGAWAVLAARAVTSIPFVRQQVSTLHGRATSSTPLIGWDLLAVTIAAVATLIDHALLIGSITVAVLIVVQRLSTLRPAARAATIGKRQMILGFALVAATWFGVLAAGGAR